MMLIFLFRLLSRIPLPTLHYLSEVLGSIAYYVAIKDRKRIQKHLKIANLPHNTDTIKAVFSETIKGGLELPIAFFHDPQAISTLFVHTYGWEHIETALATGEGLLLLTPHLGSYDLAGRYISEQLPFPLTALYKPPKYAALDKLMNIGRQRGKGRTATADRQGIKQIIQALKKGEATIVLPDHVPDPKEGSGVWADFFGQPAYTATLTGRLARMKHIRPLFFCGERLPNGQGFVLHIAPLEGTLNGHPQHDAALINHNTENWIKRFPKQYLFAYNRYKHPAGAPERP